MKTIRLYVLMGAITLLTVTRVDAATIFAPTDGDVNFLFGDLGVGAILAMFDDSDQTYTGPSIEIQVPSIVGIVGPTNGNYFATNSLAQTLTLTGSDNFILGLSIDGGATWMADSLVVAEGANSFSVFFNNNGSVLQVDVQVIPAIPLPAAVWLFGSGLIGLVGMTGVRRKA